MPDFPVLFAYIDPGTGSYVLQLALAGLLGAGYTIRRFWGRIARSSDGRPRRSPTIPNAEAAADRTRGFLVNAAGRQRVDRRLEMVDKPHHGPPRRLYLMRKRDT